MNIFIDYETANALCNLCNGPMPCYCEPTSPVDYETDDEARNHVDTVVEIWHEPYLDSQDGSTRLQYPRAGPS